jgi:hypothetical protein
MGHPSLGRATGRRNSVPAQRAVPRWAAASLVTALMAISGSLPATVRATESQADPAPQAPESPAGAATNSDPWGPEPVRQPAAGSKQNVELDSLLRLPSSFEQKPVERRAGSDEARWRERFARSRDKIAEEQAALDSTVRELEEMAGGAGSYGVAPPGAGADATTSPVSFRLRQELKRRRDAVEAAEREYRGLVVQADLGDVPQQWRGPPVSEDSEASGNAGE